MTITWNQRTSFLISCALAAVTTLAFISNSLFGYCIVGPVLAVMVKPFLRNYPPFPDPERSAGLFMANTLGNLSWVLPSMELIAVVYALAMIAPYVFKTPDPGLSLSDSIHYWQKNTILVFLHRDWWLSLFVSLSMVFRAVLWPIDSVVIRDKRGFQKRILGVLIGAPLFTLFGMAANAAGILFVRDNNFNMWVHIYMDLLVLPAAIFLFDQAFIGFVFPYLVALQIANSLARQQKESSSSSNR
jgi:hypothetical protein